MCVSHCNGILLIEVMWEESLMDKKIEESLTWKQVKILNLNEGLDTTSFIIFK